MRPRSLQQRRALSRRLTRRLQSTSRHSSCFETVLPVGGEFRDCALPLAKPPKTVAVLVSPRFHFNSVEARSRASKRGLKAYDSQPVALREATASIASMTAPIPFTSLDRTARTPAAAASSDSCGVANIVYINMEHSGARPLITRAASSPFITGIA